MTPFSKVYQAFLSRVTDDEWADWMIEEAEADWHSIMESALPSFRFPRKSLKYNDEGFLSDLGNEEIQIIADFMKCEWLSRAVMSWENVKPMYIERDFSQANLLDKLVKTLESSSKKALERESGYYRSIDGKPFKYSRLAGDPNGQAR